MSIHLIADEHHNWTWRCPSCSTVNQTTTKPQGDIETCGECGRQVVLYLPEQPT